LVATTFSGLGSSKALAGSSHSKTAVTRTIAERLDPVESVFVFGDDLDAVNYEMSFVPEARDAARLGAACQAVFSDQPAFEAAVHAADKAKAIADDLLDAAEPTVELCFDALSADEDAEARAAEGFATFHELAFDFADALK
jgi:hypothetical protein